MAAEQAEQVHQGPLAANQVKKTSVFTRFADVALLSFRRIADFVQGHVSMSNSRAWLLGINYGEPSQANEQKDGVELTPEAQEKLLQDFQSRIWCTYRRGFTTLGADQLATDVGWGCTIRSGQMMLAEALLRHTLGRSWRRQAPSSAAQSCSQQPQSDYDAALHMLLSHFQDHPAAALSIHNICKAGQIHGLTPGKWLGPWALCKAMSALVNSQPELGVACHVVCDPGGGAPGLRVQQLTHTYFNQQHITCTEHAVCQQCSSKDQPLRAANGSHNHINGNGICIANGTNELHGTAAVPCAATSSQAVGSEDQQQGQAQPMQAVGSSYQEHTPADVSNTQQPGMCTNSSVQTGSLDQSQTAGIEAQTDRNQPCNISAPKQEHSSATLQHPDTDHVQLTSQQTCEDDMVYLSGLSNDKQHLSAAANVQQSTQQQGLVLLLPLTLGVGKANPVYYPQLLQVLTFPQTIGIVGGRPSASLFFVGHQDSNLLYLDPHIAQAAGSLPAALPTFFCNAIRMMPISNIDPSLAIGFYCRSIDELHDLSQRLEELAQQHHNAPIVIVTRTGGQDTFHTSGSSIASMPNHEALGGCAEDWEML